MSKVPQRAAARKSKGNIDTRKQLFNDCKWGKIDRIQLGLDQITQLRGVLYDLDPALFRRGLLLPKVPIDPVQFYHRIARIWLARHPTLRKAEVRNSGTGLHAILWLEPPVNFVTADDRERWAGIVQVVQAALPIDPHQPGITATTRTTGSINSKNGAEVKRLRNRMSTTAEDLMTLYDQMCASPFKTVFSILTGKETLLHAPGVATMTRS